MLSAFITITVIIIMLVLMIRNDYDTVIIFLGAVAFFITTKIITVKEALSGFSNEGMLTVAVLFVVAGALQKSPLLSIMANKLFGSDVNGRKPLSRIMFPISALSAFINNTPIVAIFMPIIRNWAIQRNISPSKFLIPLCYATSLGGIITLIGTSTNLVVSGMLQEYGQKPLHMFEQTPAGLIVALIGIAFILVYAYKLLPDNQNLLSAAKRNFREYLVSFIVESNCSIKGKSIENAELRNLKGLYLFEIVRGDQKIYPLSPDVIIQEQDRLIFVGQTNTLIQLQNIEGLKLLTSADDYNELFHSDDANIVEAVVSSKFPFLNQSIKESNFRSFYNAAVVAVIRHGERLNEKIGQIILQPSDTLLLLTHNSFINKWEASDDFYLISETKKEDVLSKRKSIIAIMSFFSLIILASTGILSIFHSSLLALCVIMFTKTLNIKQAFKLISWDTLLIIIFSFGVANALINSGAAQMIAAYLIKTISPVGPIGALFVVYFVTNLFSMLVTNNAAAVLAFPIAYSTAMQMNLSPKPFAIAVIFAASASYATPIAYQTNMMVTGPGGYTFKDFFRIGMPLTLILMIASMIIIPIFFPF